MKETDMTMQALVDYIGLLKDKQREYDFDWINNHFVNFDLNQEPEFLVGVLRITIVNREYIKEWKPLLYRVKDELEIRGLNSKRILIGLL